VTAAGRSRGPRERSVEVALDEFAWEALGAESSRLGVAADELLTFALLYYLADIDSGRVARDIHRSPAAPAGAKPSAPSR
jgi:hypothetical protein